MAQLSPKQYIQSKARTLPIYKCFINKDWEEGKLAQIIIMRRHVNGNITAGVYLIDLLCLGVKDTLYFFNEPEAEMQERFGDDFDKMFEQAEYNLLHNIIFAGHDFAMDFDIKPHPEFAVTKFILEEDNDDIELIDIEVGQDDKPHLMVAQAGQFSDALAKLKKNAGEGNYYYTIAADFEDEEDEEDSFEDEEGEEEDDGEGEDEDTSYYDMDEFDLGEITPLQAQFIYTDDLLDEEKISGRMANEVLTIQTEAGLRAAREIDSTLFDYPDMEEDPDLAFYENENFTSGITEEQAEETVNAQQQIVDFFQNASQEGELFATESSRVFYLAKIEEHKNNPVIIASIFENAVFIQDIAITEAAKAILENFSADYPLASLTLALASAVNDEYAPAFSFIYNSDTLAAAFTGKTDLADFDLNTFGLIQTLFSLRNGDLKRAIYYYYYAAETEVFNWMLPLVQAALSGVIAKLVEESGLEEGYDGDNDSDDDKPTLRVV